MTTVLLVEDDPAISEPLARAFGREGYEVLTHGTGKGALEEVSAADIIVLDLGLPDIDGLDVARQVRAQGLTIPILMLTARSEDSDLVVGLDAGADDYVTKPFKSKELLARVSTRLRRTNPGAAEHVRAGDLDIDVAGHQVKRGESVISLTPLEFELLVTLARSPWKVFTREELLSQVWGYQHPADTRLVNVHVQRLRAKIEKDPERPSIVVTVRGVGYRVGESA